MSENGELDSIGWEQLATDVTSLLCTYRFETGGNEGTVRDYLRRLPYPIAQAIIIAGGADVLKPFQGDPEPTGKDATALSELLRNTRWLFRTCVGNFHDTFGDRMAGELASAALLPFPYSMSQSNYLTRCCTLEETSGAKEFERGFHGLMRRLCGCPCILDDFTPLYIPKGKRAIYRCTFRVDGKRCVYVGQTASTASRYRNHFAKAQDAWWSDQGTYFHKMLARSRGVIRFHHAFFAYGSMGPEISYFLMGKVLQYFRVIELCDTANADERERWWIKELETCNRATGGCNTAKGGQGKQMTRIGDFGQT